MSERYDAGLLNDYGGGNTEWWQDYVRAEIGRANDFHADIHERSEATIAALKAENERLREALEQIMSEAKVSNDVIRMNRDGGGNGRVKVATAMHRIEREARAALTKQEGGA